MSCPRVYTAYALPDIKISHHPSESPTVTPVVILALDRPQARNAFTNTMAESLVTAFRLLSSDPRVRCIVLTGSDPTNSIFCAGMDLSLTQGKKKASNFGSPPGAYSDAGGRVALSMQDCTKPIIAAINGTAVGVGITMTLPANIRVISKRAKVGFVFGRRGVTMEACSSFFLPRLLGTSRALHLLTTGIAYTATDRLIRPIFGEIVDPDAVLPTALTIAEDIARNVSGIATKLNKDLLYHGLDALDETHQLESRLFLEMIQSGDGQEGMKSFLEKRSPNFTASLPEYTQRHEWWKRANDSKL